MHMWGKINIVDPLIIAAEALSIIALMWVTIGLAPSGRRNKWFAFSLLKEEKQGKTGY